MRIGLFTDNYAPLINGVVTSIQMLEKGLKALGHEVYIFTFDFYDEKHCDKPEIYRNNVVVFKSHRVPIKSLNTFRLSAATLDKIKLIKDYKLDMIHVHTEFSAGSLAVKAAKRLNIPLVYTFHTLYDDYFRYFSEFLDKHYKWALRKTFRTIIKPINKRALIKIVPTNKVLEYTPLYGIKGDIRICPTGIDLSGFLSVQDEKLYEYLRFKYDLKDSFVFSFIGRISKEKSLSDVITAFSNICKGKNTKLLIVGDGPYLSEAIELVESLGISSQVVFAGFIPWKEVSDYYKMSDVFVNASMTETQGLTYIEALASGLPLLVRNDKCLDNVLYDRENGIGFDTIDELEGAMNELIDNPELSKKLASNTKKSVEKFSEMCYAKCVEKIYIDAIKAFNK